MSNSKKIAFFETPIDADLVVPGDKSISQRVAIMASLTKGVSRVSGFLRGEDAISTLNAMYALGAGYEFRGEDLFITGMGGTPKQPASPLNMGNSGTGTRLLTGWLSGVPIETRLTGDRSLSSRPMRRIGDPLRKMGAELELSGKAGTLPINIHGRQSLQAIEYSLPVASAQVKSALLLAGLHAEGTTRITEPRPTRDHTERLFKACNIPIEVDGPVISLPGFGSDGPELEARDFKIPGDISSAAFWMVAIAAKPGAHVRIRNLGLNPRRTAIIDVLRRMGADIQLENVVDAEEPYGDLKVSGSRLHGVEIGGMEIPNLIDEIPALAVAGAFADGEMLISDAEELRVKESDRIASTAALLNLFGGDVEEHDDGLLVRGGAVLKVPRVPIDSFGDHRIAMSAAIMAFLTGGEVVIENVDCVETSYPGFWRDLDKLRKRL